MIITTFLGEETEAQRKAVTCPKSHSWEVAEVGFPLHKLLASFQPRFEEHWGGRVSRVQ